MPTHPLTTTRPPRAVSSPGRFPTLRLAGVVAGLLALALPASAAVHVVAPGETLSGIAARHGTSTSALARANGLARVDLVIAGHRLTVPEGSTGTSGTYRVAPGDTLSTIAARLGVSTGALATANGIANRNVVVIGRTLTVPSGGTGGATGTGGPVAATRTGTHRVARGETLSHIALRYGVRTSALASANNISDPNRVVVGRVLTVPSAAAQATNPTGAVAAAATGTGTHRVARGETLSHIALRYGVRTSALASANNISDPNRVVVGRVLTVPSATAQATNPTAAGPVVAPSGYPRRLRAEPSRLALVPLFHHWAATYGVPVDLLMAMTWLESGWQNHVVSSTGAAGIGQLMPDTVTWMEEIIIREPLDASDPSDNIRMSARYLRWLLDRTGDARTSLAGYYQGLRSVREIGLYDDTVRYVDGVLALRSRFG